MILTFFSIRWGYFSADIQQQLWRRHGWHVDEHARHGRAGWHERPVLLHIHQDRQRPQGDHQEGGRQWGRDGDDVRERCAEVADCEWGAAGGDEPWTAAGKGGEASSAPARSPRAPWTPGRAETAPVVDPESGLLLSFCDELHCSSVQIIFATATVIMVELGRPRVYRVYSIICSCSKYCSFNSEDHVYWSALMILICAKLAPSSKFEA